MTIWSRRLAVVVAIALTAAMTPGAAAARPAASSGSSVPSGGSTLSLGTDGRLTVLVIGSDYRPGYTTERTDVMMVVSLDPAAGTVAIASVPRDTVHVPRALTNGGGNTGSARINGMMWGYHGLLTQRLARFKDDIAFTLGIEIDYYAYVRFTGFDALVAAIEGATVDIPARIIDRNYNDYGSLPFGIKFPVATGYWLGGASTPPCPDWTVDCDRALPYVRSRHGKVGTVSNSDWMREGRQQVFMIAIITKVLARGPDTGSETPLSDLRDAIADPDVNLGVTTDMPTTLADAVQLFTWLGSAPTVSAQVVFKPSKWESQHSGDPTYTYRLRLAKVRGWIATHMPAVLP